MLSSFSALQLYQKCPHQYFLAYLGNLVKVNTNSLYSLVGTAIHRSLYLCYKEIQSCNIPSKEQWLHIFTETWDQTFEVKKEHFDTSLLNQKYQTFLAIFGKYYDTHFPFDQEIIVGLEQKLFISIGNNTLSCQLDKITKKGDTFLLYDYKTNEALNEEKLALHREQMILYARALYENYGRFFQHLEIHLEYIATQEEKIFMITPEDIKPIQDKYTQLINEIQEKTYEYHDKDPDEQEGSSQILFPPHQGNHCSFCVFHSICPLSSSAPENVDIKELSERMITTLFEKFLQLKLEEKQLKKEKSDLKDQIITLLQERGCETITGTDFEIHLVKRPSRIIKDLPKLQKILKEHHLDNEITHPDTKSLIRYLKEHNLYPDTRTTTTNPTLITKSTK